MGERRPPSITTAKPRQQEGDKGVAKLKCTRIHFCPVPVSLTFCYPCNPSRLTNIAPLRGVLIRIAEKFCAEGEKKIDPLFGHFWDISGPKFIYFGQSPFFPNQDNCLIEATLRIRAYTRIFRCFSNKGNAFAPIFLDLIKATPNKGSVFEPNLSKTIVATLLLFGGLPPF